MSPRSRIKEGSHHSDPTPLRLCKACGLAFHPKFHADLTCPPCLRAAERKRAGRRGAA
jgi:hypothetical protein